MSSPRWRALGSVAAIGLLAVVSAAFTVVVALDRTLLSARFHERQLNDAGIFRTLTSDFVPAATASRLRRAYPQVSEPVLAEATVVATALFSEEWFRDMASRLLHAALPYLTGEATGVAVTLPIDAGLERAETVLRARLDQSPLAAVAYERLLAFAVSAVGRLGERLPFDVDPDPTVWSRALRLALPQTRVVAELGRQLATVRAWLTGTAPLELRLQLRDHQADLEGALDVLVDQGRLWPHLKDEVLRPWLTARVKDRPLLPEAGLVLAKARIVDALTALAVPEWLDATRKAVVAELFAAVSGRSEQLHVTLDLRPLKMAATDALAREVRAVIDAHLALQPACGDEEAQAMLAGHSKNLACKPSGLTAISFDLAVAAVVRARVKEALDAVVPDALDHSEEAIFARLPTRAREGYRAARRLVTDGWLIDDAAMRALASTSAVPWIERVVDLTQHGYTVVTDDVSGLLRERLGDAGTRRLERTRAAFAHLRAARLPLLVGLPMVCVFVAWAVGGSRTRRLALTLAGLTAGAFAAWLLALALESTLVDHAHRVALEARRVADDSAASALVERVPDLLERHTTAVTRAVGERAALAASIGLVALGGLFAERRWRAGPGRS